MLDLLGRQKSISKIVQHMFFKKVSIFHRLTTQYMAFLFAAFKGNSSSIYWSYIWGSETGYVRFWYGDCHDNWDSLSKFSLGIIYILTGSKFDRKIDNVYLKIAFWGSTTTPKIYRLTWFLNMFACLVN